MNRLSRLLPAIVAWFLCCPLFAQQTVDLSGRWDFAMGDAPHYNDHVTLPGSMLTNGKGNPVTAHTVWTGSTYDSSYYFNPYMEQYRREGNVKFPFFLTPATHYVGHAWYRRTVRVPRSWRGRRVVLFLERPHIETTVYVNGRRVGRQLSLSTPHQYDVTDFIRPGRTDTIAIDVYNGIENVGVGQDSHSVTDQTQGNWNGIAGRIELTVVPRPVIRVIPDIAARKVTIMVDGTPHEMLLGDSMRLWSETDPYLYTRTLVHRGQPLTVTFGVRDIAVRGRQFLLNGQPIWLRGTRGLVDAHLPQVP